MWRSIRKNKNLRTQRRGLLRWWGLALVSGWLVWTWLQKSAQKKSETFEAEQEPESQSLEIPSVPVVSDAGAEASEPESPVAVSPDTLTRIEGIGPKVSGVLGEAGVLTFAQLAEASVEQLNGWLQAAGLAFMDPATWPQQASLAAAGDWEGLKALQAALKGGRRD